MDENQPCVNTDVQLFTTPNGIEVHRTADERGLGINVGGYVIVKSPAAWHALASEHLRTPPEPAADLVSEPLRMLLKVCDEHEALYDTGQMLISTVRKYVGAALAASRQPAGREQT